MGKKITLYRLTELGILCDRGFVSREIYDLYFNLSQSGIKVETHNKVQPHDLNPLFELYQTVIDLERRNLVASYEEIVNFLRDTQVEDDPHNAHLIDQIRLHVVRSLAERNHVDTTKNV